MGNEETDMIEDQGRDVGEPAVEAHASSAARLLEMTARETDQWRSDARAEATGIVATARSEADALVQAARKDAETMIEAAQLEAARTLTEAQTSAEEVRKKTEHDRRRAEVEVADLHHLASDHVQHLRRHLNDMLARLESVAAPDPRTSDDA